jgi:DNA polymerase-1
MSEKRLFLVDATAFCYRAFYAVRNLATSTGIPTNAVYGFTNMLNKVIRDFHPEYLAVCFDVSRDTFRQKKFAEYKMQRPSMPDTLTVQIPFIKRIVQAYGITLLEKEGYEADDIIATLAARARESGWQVTIISSDKDILQLVDGNTVVFNPQKDDGILYDESGVATRFAVAPSRLADVLALMGDDVDNIPGVPGIGEKTAVDLIKQVGSLDNLLMHPESIKRDKLRTSIVEHFEQIKLNRELIGLRFDVDMGISLEQLKINATQVEQLRVIFKELEFKKLMKDLPPEEEEKPELPVQEWDDAALAGVIKQRPEVYLYGSEAKDMVFYADRSCFRVSSCGENMKSLLSAQDIKKIGHDLKKIELGLAKDDIDFCGGYFDTMVAGYLLNSTRSDYSLGDLACAYLDRSSPDISDSVHAMDILLKLKPKLAEGLEACGLSELFFTVEMPLVEVLAEMEKNGIQIDVKAIQKLSRTLEERLISLIEEIYSLSGMQFNINSTKQLREVLFNKLQLPVLKKSKTGPSTDEEVLRKLAKKHKLPALLLEYRQLMKLKTTYSDVLPNLVHPKTGRVHTSFNQTGTETGRLSSSNPNLQNIPVKTDIGRLIRRAIVAYDTHSFLLSCDYSQIELRILAHVAQDANLMRAFKENKDIHRATAALIYGIQEKDITEPMRDTAKRVNFGIIYGLTSYGLSRDLGISVEDAQGFIDAYFLRYPRVQEYMQEQIAKAEQEGFVTTILGRRRYLPEINNKNLGVRQFAQRQAVNTPIQGSASDLIKCAMVKIYRELKAAGYKTKMILQIHDELVFNVPSGEMQAIVKLVRQCMEQVLDLTVPIKVDIKKGENWLDMEEVKEEGGL